MGRTVRTEQTANRNEVSFGKEFSFPNRMLGRILKKFTVKKADEIRFREGVDERR